VQPQGVRFPLICARKGGGSVSKRDDGFLNNGREKVVQGDSEGGKLLRRLIHVRVLSFGPDGGRLGSGVHHQGLDGFYVKEGLGGLTRGGYCSVMSKALSSSPSSPMRGRLKEPDLGRKFLDVSKRFAETTAGLLLVPVTGGIKEESGMGFILKNKRKIDTSKIN
jgi:hypothetical protein